MERKTKGHEMKILPKNWNTPALFTIYSDTVGIHLGNEKSIISIVIKNANISQSFRTSFQAMWKISNKINKNKSNKFSPPTNFIIYKILILSWHSQMKKLGK